MADLQISKTRVCLRLATQSAWLLFIKDLEEYFNTPHYKGVWVGFLDHRILFHEGGARIHLLMAVEECLERQTGYSRKEGFNPESMGTGAKTYR